MGEVRGESEVIALEMSTDENSSADSEHHVPWPRLSGPQKGTLMNIRKTLFNATVAFAVTFGMAGGALVGAVDDSDTDDTVVVVGCAETATVDIDIVGKFRIDASSAASSYNASLPGGFRMTLDLTCNWSNDFQVSATIGDFEYDGVAPGSALQSFSGAHLRLDNGSGIYTGPDVYGVAGAPNIESSVFELFETSDPDAVENAWDWIFIPFWGFFPVPIASPGVTVATWDGSLVNVPGNLADGEYIAPLTVELTVN